MRGKARNMIKILAGTTEVKAAFGDFSVDGV
jgi:hypothetical protein